MSFVNKTHPYTVFLTGVLSWFLFSISVYAQPGAGEDVETQSTAYLNAIWAADWDKMGSYLTDESVYQDFTMQYFGGDEIDLVGRDAIVAFYRNANDDSGVKEVRNEIVYHFVAGNSIVYELNTTVKADGAYWEVPDEELTATFRVVSFVQMANGKVVRHIDFSDYDSAMTQVYAQVEAYKKN